MRDYVGIVPMHGSIDSLEFHYVGSSIKTHVVDIGVDTIQGNFHLAHAGTDLDQGLAGADEFVEASVGAFSDVMVSAFRTK